jgi:hypothetical protein
LHYVAANGVEGYRQKTPKNAVKVAEILLNAGAEVGADFDYGSLRRAYPERAGSTPLGLVATSVRDHCRLERPNNWGCASRPRTIDRSLLYRQ